MDMVNPTMDELLKKVDSKYTLVVLAAKRARQLLDGAELKVTMKSTKNVTNALEEIIEDRIKYERTKEVVK
ncbi:DNA-directed RNA polymerase subunit omega [Propionispira arboris]|jgi:DNA-directed RNA polymerase subunit omega|uniref:DNA-directed RNA polymerase subunit omega n=1 Tax=Propionispira arboris TaxID=84035 RepID=A0A1H6W8L3_9FIRM|nr:DNA-directed RNA polymerase subunit omega [Propionispira arboris]SEJ11564.1 DNA-directed RNA polymerase subunit omega [Propionispira arboris]